MALADRARPGSCCRGGRPGRLDPDEERDRLPEPWASPTRTAPWSTSGTASRRSSIRDSKIERIVGDNAFRTGEKFQLVQPLVVHAGAMPKEVISVEAGAWNDRGRRSFRYVGLESEQAGLDGAGHHRDRPARGQVPRSGRLLARAAGHQPGAAAGDDRPARPCGAEEPGRARAGGPVPDGRGLVSRGQAGARPDDQGFPQDRPGRAGQRARGRSSSRPRPPSGGPRSTSAARPSSSARRTRS